MRDHIDFIQAQYLDWQSADALGFAGAKYKLLSRDYDTGAMSAILSLPGGFKRDAQKLGFDEEIYVMDGAADIGGNGFLAHSYALLPAGHGVNGIDTPEGVTLLYFRSEVITDDRATDPAKIASRLVQYIDIANGSWDGDFDKFGLGSMKTTARMRVLRSDPFTGENTYITCTIGFRKGERAERHPVGQEFFLFSGELAGPQGVMQGGAYCIRPPMAKHAPYGSPTGAVLLFRSFGGSQETFWEDTDPFTFTPEHRPILPDHLNHLGKPYPAPAKY